LEKEKKKSRKICGHMKVHRKKKRERERKIAMLSNQRWRKNLIMLRSNHDCPISTFPHTCTP
jgi:hypothetical protein